MILSASDARERIRLILDRANSPWLTNSEINGFIEMSINEYVRERINMYEANQVLRDDFGGLVKSVVFSREPIGETEASENTVFEGDVFRRQYTKYNQNNQADYGADVMYEVVGGEWATNSSAGSMCHIKDEEEDDKLHFGYLLEVKILSTSGTLSQCKIMGVDEALRTKNDPFNTASSFEYHAIRINNIYYIRPGSGTQLAVFTYVSNDNSVDKITELPHHGREEVCQIAARKIMGTVADERQAAADNEIKQLEGK